MNKDTIIYIGNFELPDKDAAALRVLGNAKALTDKYNIVFISSSKTLNETYKYSVVNKFDNWVFKYPTSLLEWGKWLTSIQKYEKIFKEYDNVCGVIAYNYPAIALSKLRKYCKKNQLFLVSDATEWFEDKRIAKRIDTAIRMRFINKRVDGVICISSFLYNYYSRFTKTVTIPPLIDSKDSKWVNPDYKIVNNIIRFVYFGNPGKHKDKINLAIKTLTNYQKPFDFKVVGITREEYLNMYPEDVTRLSDNKESIVFLGKLDHIKALDIVKTSDFLLFFREDKRVNNAGFPTKLVESITLGVPVITNSTSDISQYITSNNNGYLIHKLDDFNISRIITVAHDNFDNNIKINVNRETFELNKFAPYLESFISSLKNEIKENKNEN